jgi:hypothetical protein
MEGVWPCEKVVGFWMLVEGQSWLSKALNIYLEKYFCIRGGKLRSVQKFVAQNLLSTKKLRPYGQL